MAGAADTLTILATWLALGIFVGLLGMISLQDLARRQIDNRLVALLAAAFAFFAPIADWQAGEIGGAVLGAAAIFGLGLFCFSRGWLGGGDVKLAAVCGLWLGAGLVPAFLLISAVCGAVITLIQMAHARLRAPAGPAPAEVAYGPGIALASVLLVAMSPWFTGPAG